MGYYSTVRGRISFEPPITYGEVKSSGYVITNGQNYVDKDIELESFGPNSINADELYSIIPSSEDSYKVYDITKHLKELLNILGPGRVYSGYLEIHGEGRGEGDVDLWRLRIKDGKVEEVHPKLVWPE